MALNKLITAVSDTESATSPFAKNVNILDVTPPGAADINITPIAISMGRGQIVTNTKPTIGRKMSWLISPIKKFFGFLKTFEKSETDNPSPKVNIIKARAKGRITSVTKFISKFSKYF